MNATDEINAGTRFGFGANWTRFLAELDEERILAAQRSLSEMLGSDDLRGRSFLDIGSGSGLFSLAARRLGARVHSFDFDPQSVACTRELRRRFFPEDPEWRVEEGSALDAAYIRGLGQFDVVYSWGVLHHTGAMWVGIEHAVSRVAPGGTFYIAIYNDQGWKSHVWWFIKSAYNRLPRWLRSPFALSVSALVRAGAIIKYTLKGRPMVAIKPMFTQRRDRGMSARWDEVDWIGGFPFEVASFATLESYFVARGFSLLNARRNDSWGCNELALRRTACAD
jgi:2-polyprenyl-3-methyl-5-hydroxy-6-metoxy-1,4-benzoquinol methylase